jgi:eukaryotic-like serine/threonine-protein kinase
MSDFEPGTIVDARYRLLERVGSGGMADVFAAEDLQLGRNVALKLLHRRFAADPEFVERFRREASAAGGLQHPNVVGVYDRGEHGGTQYIAMELLEGRSLKRVVQEEAPLDPGRAIDLTEQVLRAARFAHKRGVIHRDLKPHNVIVDAEGRSKVTDFGIARAGASDMTETGSIMGTAQYLAPEQAQGQPVGATADLYAVGVILYELLTGRVPFEGDSAVAIAMKQVNEAPVPPSHLVPSVPPALEQVVLTALQKDPAHRFQDADSFMAALATARQQLPVPAGFAPGESTQVIAGPLPPAEPPPYAPVQALPLDPAGPRRDRRGLWWALGAAVVVAGLVALALLLGGGREVTVPEVRGAPEAAAKQALSRRGLRSDVSRQTSPNVAAGTVIGQDPGPGVEVEEGATVQLVVSDGPGVARIPDVRGEGRNAARRALTRLGFMVREREEASSEVGENRVVETTPAAGTELERGETVTLVVSSGAPRVLVPGVVGQERAAAERTLRERGLEVAVREQESQDREPGTVLAQDPPAGRRVREGATVTLTVAAEPADVEVPDVTGRSQAEATEALSGAGFTVRVTEQEVDSPDQDGVVLSQSPTGRRPRGARVTIVVGTFNPDLDPDPTPTTTTPAPATTTPEEPTE